MNYVKKMNYTDTPDYEFLKDLFHACYEKSGVNFINILLEPFLLESVLQSFSLVTVCLCNFLVQEYRRKSCSENVDKINYRILIRGHKVWLVHNRHGVNFIHYFYFFLKARPFYIRTYRCPTLYSRERDQKIWSHTTNSHKKTDGWVLEKWPILSHMYAKSQMKNTYNEGRLYFFSLSLKRASFLDHSSWNLTH